ncbi:MAG: hypothetical protein KDD82_21315 [Planctomycetes bacterium]|nr:hypothetical protein [Planctomycetota bacterium]
MYPQQPGPSHRTPRDEDDDEGFYDPLESDEGQDDDFGFEDDDSPLAEEGDDAFDDSFDDQDDGEPFAAPSDEPDDPF